MTDQQPADDELGTVVAATPDYWRTEGEEASDPVHPIQFPDDATEWERACYAGYVATRSHPDPFAEWRARQSPAAPPATRQGPRPPDAAYEVAARARILVRIPDATPERLDEILRPGSGTRDVWLTDGLRAAVDAVWPLDRPAELDPAGTKAAAAKWIADMLAEKQEGFETDAEVVRYYNQMFDDPHYAWTLRNFVAAYIEAKG